MTIDAPVVVFDFDLTLTKVDNARRFYRWLVLRQPWRLGLVVVAAPGLAVLALATLSRKWFGLFWIWAGTLGVRASAVPQLVQEHIASLSDDPASIFLDAAVDRLREHLHQGHRVVIATGSPKPLARAFLRHAGLDNVPLIGTCLRSHAGGLARDPYCHGDDKLLMLQERGFFPPWASVYTDHRSDLPILRHSSASYLVSPKRECLASIERELESKPTVLLWR
ncbi:HAD family hydrolase [Lysobacter korlensis]|uniref:HAD family hydrolase n=1 Tax=Lysobacter korlensis TaxID=553636 RepID=A0ABV6RRH2_9GAMM